MHNLLEQRAKALAIQANKDPKMYVQSLGGAKLAGKPFITFLVEYASKAIKRPENVEKELEEGNPNYKEILIYRQGYNKGVDDLLDFLTKE